MEKKNNFSIIPNWLVDEFKTAKEFQAYLKMYNGWCLMQDADGWYYRSISKLKEDFGMNPKCSRTRVTQLIKRFEELGILHIKSNGKGTNWYKFDEVVLFNHIEENEEEGREQDVPQGREQDVPQGREQVVPHQEEGVGNKLYPLYNTKENIKENILELDDTSTRDQDVKNIKENILELDDTSTRDQDVKNIKENILELDNSNETHNMFEIPDYMMGVAATKYSYWDNPQLYVTLLTMDSEAMYRYSENGVLNKVKEAVSQIDDEELKNDLNKRLEVAWNNQNNLYNFN